MRAGKFALAKLSATIVAVALITLAVVSVPGGRYLIAFPHLFTSQVVAETLHYLPVTLELVVVSLLVACVIGYGLALLSFRPLKAVVGGIGLALRSIPFFLLALSVQYAFAYYSRLPTYGYAGSGAFNLEDHLAHLVLPAGTLALFLLPAVVEYLSVNRNSAPASVLRGLAKRFAGKLPEIIAATMITEIFFAWPGAHVLFWSFPTASSSAGFLFYSALVVVLMRFAADAVPQRTSDAP